MIFPKKAFNLFSVSKGSIELLLEVRFMPPSVFHGYGDTCNQARQHAASLALKYIRCLSKQHQQSASSTITTTPTVQTSA